jgi:hypothetical protein
MVFNGTFHNISVILFTRRKPPTCFKLEMPVKNQLQGMLAVFEPLDRAQSKKNFEPSFVKIG